MKNIDTLVAVASGRKMADIAYCGAFVLNVFTHKWEQKDIYLCGSYIAAVMERNSYKAERTVDVCGKWIVPGFIDAHVHIESSMVLPYEFARAVSNKGTTTVIADSHEIANVLGPDAIRFMLRQSESAAADIYFMVPSCVPSTAFEHSGGVVTSSDIAAILRMPRVIGLGEMMNYQGVINGDECTLDKLNAAFFVNGAGALIDGHAPLVTGKHLQAYCASGIRTDHECHTFEEAAEKIKVGMYILLRQGSSARDVERIVPALAKSSLPLNRFCFCTDDKNIADIIHEGHIDSNIRRAIALGLKAEDAYVMASFNTAECYRLIDTGAICPGYKADFVVLDDYKSVSICSVVKSGRAASANTAAPAAIKDRTEAEELFYKACHCVNVDETSVTESMFYDSVSPVFSRYTIEIQCGSLNTKKCELKAGEATAGLKDGTLCRLSVIERHKKTGAHSLSLLRGYGLVRGAIAMSIGHDSHNIICAGSSPANMAAAVKRICQMQGGIAIVESERVIAELPLPVAGLMSSKSAIDVASLHEKLLLAARKLGIPHKTEPFVTLSFLALPVIPELRLTDSGLFDVTQWKFLQ